jgi:outer membrane lipoprotein-sorting protein
LLSNSCGKKEDSLEGLMRIYIKLFVIFLFLAVGRANAVTVDELIAKNIEARGGLEKLKAIHSMRMTGKIQFDSFHLGYAFLAKRPAMMRQEASFQGMTAVTAYDGSLGWKIQPFFGRVDPEKMSGDEVKQLELSADIDGPLVDYKAKGNTVEYLGTEDVDGTDAYKLKVTLKNGDVRIIYLDPDYFLEIRWLDQTWIRGTQQEQETDLGSYEKVEGVYLPFSYEIGEKGKPKGQKVTFEKAEINPELDDNMFHFPAKAAGK